MNTQHVISRRRRKGNSASKSFARILRGVPSLVQRQIIEKTLLPFLDNLPRSYAKRTVIKARRIAKTSEEVPQLDLAAKKTEVNGLLEELTKDAKAPIRNRTNNYITLMREVVESVAGWLNDLWSLACEVGIDFPRAHSCLMFSMGVLDHIQGMKGSGCRCFFASVYVPVRIKDRTGNVVKEFTEVGMTNVESAILWVWREVFLGLLSSNNSYLVDIMPELLAEIDEIIGWEGLERLVLGGFTYSERTSDLLQRSMLHCGNQHTSQYPDEACADDEEDLDDLYYEEHWNHKFSRRVPQFRKMVQDRMIQIFKASPSVDLYRSMVNITFDEAGGTEVLTTLAILAPTSATCLSTAIQIWAHQNWPSSIAEILKTHAFLLRPRDSEALQIAVRCLGGSDEHRHHIQALIIVEKELLDTARALQHALQGPFSRIDSPDQRAELGRIMKLRRGSADRQERVESWVEAACTPGLGPANPMVFAAMMMGLPVPAALEAVDEAEHLGFLEFDPNDPDLADLKEEHRSDFKGRFEGWVDTLEAIDCGQEMLQMVYRKISNMMPWVVGTDIVEEMVARIADKPSKHHICDALECMAQFAKIQRKRHRRKTTMPVESADHSGTSSIPILPLQVIEPEEVPEYDNSTPDQHELEDEDEPEDDPEVESADPGMLPFHAIGDGIEDLD